MKIKVHDKDTKLNIVIPNRLITGAPGRKIIAFFACKYGGDIPLTREQMDRLLKELGKAAKQFKGLKIVEVESSDGEQVLIEL